MRRNAATMAMLAVMALLLVKTERHRPAVLIAADLSASRVVFDLRFASIALAVALP